MASIRPNRLNVSGGGADDFLEIVAVLYGHFASVLETGNRFSSIPLFSTGPSLGHHVWL